MVQGGEFSVCAGYRQHIWIHLSFPQKNDTSPSYPQHIWIHRPQRPFGLPHIWIHLRPQKQHIWIHFSPKNNIFGYIAFGFALRTQQKSGAPIDLPVDHLYTGDAKHLKDHPLMSMAASPRRTRATLSRTTHSNTASRRLPCLNPILEVNYPPRRGLT